MKLRQFLLTLLLVFGLTAGMAAPAWADAAVEEFWYYSYDVDKTIVVNASDGLGLYMRYGAGTEYDKVHPQTIPMYTKLHITHETTDSRGWKWGYTVYDFPDTEWEEEGWVCLVETYEVGSAPAQPQPQETPEVIAPAEEPEEPAESQNPDTTPDPETADAEEPAEEAAPEAAPAPQGSSMTSSLMLVGIGVVIGVVVLTALLLLLRKKK